MPFNLKELNPAAKFSWPGSKDEWVKFRAATIEELNRIRSKSITPLVEYHAEESGVKPWRYEYEKVDDKAVNDMLWDYQIVDWNIVDENGKKIPCTRANKLLLIYNSNEFADFAMDSVVQLRTDRQERRKKTEKN